MKKLVISMIHYFRPQVNTQTQPTPNCRVSPAQPGSLEELLSWNLAAGRLVYERVVVKQ